MGRAANGDGPCRREKPGLPPMVSLREHRGTHISIKLISCQEKNESESRAAHPFCERDEAPDGIENRPESLAENRLWDGTLGNREVAGRSLWVPASIGLGKP